MATTKATTTKTTAKKTTTKKTTARKPAAKKVTAKKTENPTPATSVGEEDEEEKLFSSYFPPVTPSPVLEDRSQSPLLIWAERLEVPGAEGLSEEELVCAIALKGVSLTRVAKGNWAMLD